MNASRRRIILSTLALAMTALSSHAARTDAQDCTAALASVLRRVSTNVLPDAQRKQLSGMVRDDLRRRLKAANRRSNESWRNIKTRQQWERFRAPRIEALRKSLGQFPDPPKKLDLRVTGKLSGDGYRIHNLVFESRPELWVTANLYLPAKPLASMPGILICHSHHRPKEHGELQDMGMTWARAGCLVLIMDQLGHGERRQHPFRNTADYDKPFRLSRQDYYFRFDTGIQLHLVGDSLAGWMAWDLMRGVDLLLSRPGIDPKRIILLGAVAGGGDPAAVAAAVDERITAAVPFNFGGPQPETRFPLPKDVETSFNYAGSGSWESTRNLRLSADQGFLPWVIVGGIAPRRLIFAHEFNWDRPHDPVWKRLEAIYGFYDASKNLAFTHGRGELRGRPPIATHCTHIGPFHRRLIHVAFKRWFDIPMTADDEYSSRRESRELLCMTSVAQSEIKPKKLHALLTKLAAERSNSARKRRAGLPAKERRTKLQNELAQALGNIKPAESLKGVTLGKRRTLPDGASLQPLTLEVEPGILVPLILLQPAAKDQSPPVVVAIAQQGKQGFLRHRAAEIAELLQLGVAVCLPDLRGTGETKVGKDRGRYSVDTSRSATEFMLGGSMVGARLRDLRSVISYLRRGVGYPQPRVDPKRIALWGDSFALANPADASFKIPRRVEGRPRDSEPLGGMLALMGGLFDENIAAVYVHGGLSGFQSVLKSQFVHIPHDAVIPGMLTLGDLNDVAAAIAPRPLRMEGLVDGLNRRLSEDALRASYLPAFSAYQKLNRSKAICVAKERTSPSRWLALQLSRK